MLLADDGRRRYPADVAVVEDVADGTLEALLKTDPARASHALSELAAMLDGLPVPPASRASAVEMVERVERWKAESGAATVA